MNLRLGQILSRFSVTLPKSNGLFLSNTSVEKDISFAAVEVSWCFNDFMFLLNQTNYQGTYFPDFYFAFETGNTWYKYNIIAYGLSFSCGLERGNPSHLWLLVVSYFDSISYICFQDIPANCSLVTEWNAPKQTFNKKVGKMDFVWCEKN